MKQRVPLEILYSLNKESPKSQLLRSFSSIQKRIKLFCDRASKWEKEIALLLNKRRRVDPNETFSREEFEKLVEMSNCDLLSKVSRPSRRYSMSCKAIPHLSSPFVPKGDDAARKRNPRTHRKYKKV